MQIIMPSEASQMFHAATPSLGVHTANRWDFHVQTPVALQRAMVRWKTLPKVRVRPVIGDTAERSNESVKRVILCSRQVYYDLKQVAPRSQLENDIAIRVEQLYPFHTTVAELAKYPNAKSVVWAQEEPKNQGAFYQIRHPLEDVIGESQNQTV